jgi:hypothetical protein
MGPDRSVVWRVRAVESVTGDAQTQRVARPSHEIPVVHPSTRQSAALALALAGVLVGPYTAQAQSVPDTLARIRAAKQIDVAYSTDSPPFSFAGEGKRPTGYSIDLCQRVIRRSVSVPDLRTVGLSSVASASDGAVGQGSSSAETRA